MMDTNLRNLFQNLLTPQFGSQYQNNLVKKLQEHILGRQLLFCNSQLHWCCAIQEEVDTHGAQASQQASAIGQGVLEVLATIKLGPKSEVG